MSYRLKRSELPPSGLRRICRQEIEAALATTKLNEHSAGEAVHEFRKHIKKLRAALRLVASEMGKDRHRREDQALRETAKLAADLRDAHVRWQTVAQLREQFRGRRFAKVFRRIEELLSLELSSFAAAVAGWETEAAQRLFDSQTRIAALSFDRLSWKQICKAVAMSYRRGRTELRVALKEPLAENFHNWRREVKDLWYELRLIAPLNRTVLDEIARDAATLGDLLGRHHDFAFLLSRLALERDNKSLRQERAELERLVTKRSRKLERDATELGRHFYAESPKAFAKRISIFARERKAVKK